MSMSKMKIVVAAVMAIGLVAAGTGGLFCAAQGTDANTPAAQKETKPPPRDDAIDQAKAHLDAARARFDQAQATSEAATAQLMIAWNDYLRAKQLFTRAATGGQDSPPKNAPPPKRESNQPPPRNPAADADAAKPAATSITNQMDLITLGTAYIDAVRDLDTARIRINVAATEARLKVVTREELEVQKIAMQAAQRKVTLLRSIIEGALKNAQADFDTAKRDFDQGLMSRHYVLAAQEKVRILTEILGSAK